MSKGSLPSEGREKRFRPVAYLRKGRNGAEKGEEQNKGEKPAEEPGGKEEIFSVDLKKINPEERIPST